jgi:hypothetical protein
MHGDETTAINAQIGCQHLLAELGQFLHSFSSAAVKPGFVTGMVDSGAPEVYITRVL